MKYFPIPWENAPSTSNGSHPKIWQNHQFAAITKDTGMEVVDSYLSFPYFELENLQNRENLNK